MSDGSTGAVTVTYAATGGTVSTTGLYKAGTTAGTYRVIAVQQGGTKADTSAITVTATATAGARAAAAAPPTDRTVLPVAKRAATERASVRGLNVPGRPWGGVADPVTGVRVWKVTSVVCRSENVRGG